VTSLAIRRQAEDALRHELQPGEHIAAGTPAISGPSRWGMAALLAAALALVAAGLVNLLGPQPGLLPDGPVIGALPLLGLGIQFLPRPVYVAVTERRLICCRLSRLRSAPGRLAFAAPLADLSIAGYRSGTFGSSMQCEAPGQERIRLSIRRPQRQEWAAVDLALARSGAFMRLDPPYPASANS
jgi:hypothetical protein